MEEKISQQLKNISFFDFGTVIFASNHPDYVYLIETKNENDEVFTILYDKKHDYLNIDKRIDNIDIETPTEIEHVELTNEQKQNIKQFIEAKAN